MYRRCTPWLAAAVVVACLTAAAPAPKPGYGREPAPSGVAPPPDDAVIVGSCRLSKETCIDYEGSFPDGEARLRCKRLKGTWREESCTAAGRLGTCTVRETGSYNRVLTRYYRPVQEPAARAQCVKQPRAVFMAR